VFLVNVPIGLAALFAARGLLRETERQKGPFPDLAGSAALALGVGALALAIIKGTEWGWGSAEILATFAAAAVAFAVVGRRSARHVAPVVDLALFRTRSFSVAVAGTFVFSTAFYSLLLANVLFTTEVWGWSILTAGFAITPGPLMAAVFAPIGGRLSDAYGQRVVAVPGGILFALGTLWLAANTGATPDFAGALLPGMLLTGAGVGLSFAAWSSAAVAELPPARFATGSAIAMCTRQIGAVLGIAALIALLDTATPATAVDIAHDAWRAMAVVAFTSGAIGLALGRVRAAGTAPERAPAQLAAEGA
jgi:nitrate/nitrite transporter NarK